MPTTIDGIGVLLPVARRELGETETSVNGSKDFFGLDCLLALSFDEKVRSRRDSDPLRIGG